MTRTAKLRPAELDPPVVVVSDCNEGVGRAKLGVEELSVERDSSEDHRGWWFRRSQGRRPAACGGEVGI